MFWDPRPARDPGWRRADFPDAIRPIEAVISLKIWQIEAVPQSVIERANQAFTAARLAFPNYFDIEAAATEELGARNAPHEHLQSASTTAAGGRPPLAPWTVVEASCVQYQVDTPGAVEIPRMMLERAIEHVQRLQRACSYVSGRAVRPLTLQTLPVTIPLATATVTTATATPEFTTDGSVIPYLIPANMYSLANRSEFTTDEVARVIAFAERDEGFLGGVLASQAEARAALTFRGDCRASVLASATGCEILLDDLLRHLLWESGRRPEDCVSIFFDQGQVTTALKRALKHTQPYLKGQWDIAVQPELKAWQHDVARIRHMTIHAGYRPSVDQAHAALDSVDGLQRYVGDLVLAKKHKFPRTALMMFGEDELIRRNLYTAKVKAAYQDQIDNDWATRFIRWRDCLERLIDAELYPARDLEVDDLSLVAVILPPGRLTWVLRNVKGHRACRAAIEDGQVPSRTRSSLTAMMNELPSDSWPVSTLVDGLFGAVPDEDWVSEHRRLPLVEVMIDGRDFY